MPLSTSKGTAGNRTYWTRPTTKGSRSGPQDGPLALFGPYNESSASGNTAKARDTPASFTGPDGNQYIIWAGSHQSRCRIEYPHGALAYRDRDRPYRRDSPPICKIVSQNTAVMSNPGSNLITGNGTANEIDWVVDEGQQQDGRHEASLFRRIVGSLRLQRRSTCCSPSGTAPTKNSTCPTESTTASPSRGATSTSAPTRIRTYSV